MKNGLIISHFGNKYYYLNDKYHRENGPAVIRWNGDKEWWLYGLPHRENGPAKIYKASCSHKTLKYWYLHGEQVYCKNQQEFEKFKMEYKTKLIFS
jgi:hypothetical protein